MNTARALLAIAALAIAGCSKPAATATTAAASFTVNDLRENDANIQGCTTMLNRTGPGVTGEIFAEDGIDSGAKGFIRINGALINVDLVSSNDTDKGSVRVFADAARSVQIVETTVTGAAHEDSDSVEASGDLAVTYHGATQTIPVEGGTAC